MTDPRVNELVDRITALERQIRGLSTGARLSNASLEDSSISEYDRDGNLASRWGKQPDGTHGVVHYGGPIPPAPTVPEVEGGPASITAVWDGALTEAKPLDLDMVEVYAAAAPFEHIEDATLVGAIPDPDGGRVTVRRPVGDWHIGLVALSRSGKRSPVSELAVATAESVLDSGVLEELEQNLSDLDDALADLDETVLPNLRDRLDAAEATLAPLPDQIAAAEQTAADAEQAAVDAEQAALDAAGIAEGKGQVITQISPPSGSRARAENLWVRLPDHKVHIYDGEDWVAATDPDLIAAAGEAATARQEAQAAQSAAQAAQSAAEDAQAAADALGTALATVEGDLATAQGLIDDLGEDVTVAATTAAVENLYVTGTGTVNELVARRILAAYLAVQKIMANEVLIGQGGNLIVDPEFEDAELTDHRAAMASPAFSVSTEDLDQPGAAFRALPSGSNSTLNLMPTTSSVNRYENLTPVLPGDRILLRVWVRGDDSMQWRWAYRARLVDGSTAYRAVPQQSYRAAVTGWDEHAWTVPGDVAALTMELQVQAGGEGWVQFQQPSMRHQVDHSLIVDGGILARHITASEEMSAKLAEFLKVRVGQIIGDEAGFDTAVVNQLWADMFATRKLTAEEADLGSFGADEGLIQQLLTHNVDVTGHLSVQGSFAAENNEFELAISPVGVQLIAKQSLPETPDHSWVVPANGRTPRDVDGTGGRLFISSSDYPVGTSNQRNHLREWSQDGAVLWERMSPTNLRFSRIRAAGDYLVGHMRRLDGDIQTTILVMDLDGNETSRFDAGTTIADIFDVSEDGLILTGSQWGPFEPVVVSIYDTSGTTLHSWPSRYAPAFSGGRGVIEGGLVHIYGDSVIETYTLDGTHVRSINVGDVSAGLRVEDGVLFASTSTGRIQGYEAATGTPRFAWTLPYTRASQFTFQSGRLFTTPSSTSVPSTGDVFRMDRFDVGAVPAVQAEFSTVTGRLAGTGADLSGVTRVESLVARTITSGSPTENVAIHSPHLPSGANVFLDLAQVEAAFPNAPHGVEVVTTHPTVQRWIRASRIDGQPGLEWVRVWSEGDGDSGVFLLDEIELTGDAGNQVSNRLHIPSQGEYKKLVVTVSAGINELNSGEILPLMVRPNNDSGDNYAVNAIAWVAGVTHQLQNLWGNAYPRTGWVGAYPGSLEITFTINRPGWWAWITSGWANMNGEGALIHSGGRWNGSAPVNYLQVRPSTLGQTWRPNSFAQLWGHR